MNRTSRRSADEAADALLEAGRTQPVVHYDVESGLARHHHWLQKGAPLPDWASAGVGTAATSLASVAIKTLFSAVLIGALAVVAWRAQDRPKPATTAPTQLPLRAPERTQPVAPGVAEVPVAESWMTTTPIPVSDLDVPSAEPARRTVRAEGSHKRTTRVHKARAADVDADVDAQPTAQVDIANPTTAVPAAQRVHEPASAAPQARPEPVPRAQPPNNLAEMQQVAAAEHLLERSPQRALALVREGDRRFASGYFQQERAYIAIMALIRLGRIEEARTRAASFDRRFPALPYGARIHGALEAQQ